MIAIKAIHVILFLIKATNAFVNLPISAPTTILNDSISAKRYVHPTLTRLKSTNDNENDPATTTTQQEKQQTRRLFFDNAARTGRRLATATLATSTMNGLCSGCLSCLPPPAHALSQIITPPIDPSILATTYDPPRNQVIDAMFAQGMAVGMIDYENEASVKKKPLFEKLFRMVEENYASTPKSSDPPVVVEVGMGSFPNARYYPKKRSSSFRRSGGWDIIGVDPNDRMAGYARDNAARAGLLPSPSWGGTEDNQSSSFRIVHGVSEALPLADNSVDAVICTLTLCSVIDPTRSVAEIKRVLKPGGVFLFWEHVLSETDGAMAAQQVELTPYQVQRADGCHLDRRTGDVIRKAGFGEVEIEYFEFEKFGFINPTVCGIAKA